MRKRFHDRLSLTYSNPASQADDRNWLCIVSVVLALAESWNHSRAYVGSSLAGAVTTESLQNWKSGQSIQSGTVNESTSISDTPTPPPPGSELFEQALLLLKLSLEEPVVEYVQALNLIVRITLLLV